MTRILLNLIILTTLMIQMSVANAALMRNALQSCAFGAGAMAATTYLGFVPDFNTGILLIPFSEVILANAMLGCGIGVAGSTAATIVGWFYDIIF